MTSSQPIGDKFELPGQFSAPVFLKSSIYQGVPAHHESEDRLARARTLLDVLPLDRVPEVGERVLAAGSRVPHSPNPAFVGRADTLRALAKALKGAKGAAAVYQPAGISGLGGVGKTQLAVEFAHQYGPFFAGGVFWVDCRVPEGIPGEVVACGLNGCPDLPANFGRLKDQSEQVRLVAALWQSPLPRLLVLDNCEDEGLLIRLRPPGGGCRVLVTSRRPEWSLGTGLRPVPLGPLPRPDSIALLLQFRPDLAGRETELDAVADALSDLALALHLAGSYLREMEHSPLGQPARYLADLQRVGPLDHVSMQGGDWSPTLHEQHVGRTFQLSYDALRSDVERDATARLLLERAACCEPGLPIPRPLLKASLELDEDEAAERRAEGGLRRLVELGLLTRETDGFVTVHRLVAAFVLGRVDDARAAAEAAARALTDALYRANETGLPANARPLVQHARYLVDNGKLPDAADLAMLLNNLGWFLWTVANLLGARAAFERALATRERVLGPDHPEVATDVNNLGLVLQDLGDTAGARGAFERALAIDERVFGPDHPSTRLISRNLSMLNDPGEPT